jgi:hypothetical protein
MDPLRCGTGWVLGFLVEPLAGREILRLPEGGDAGGDDMTVGCGK